MERLTYRDANGEAWYSDVGTEADRLHFIAGVEDILGDDYNLDRMRELVEADREGRCVVLWCRPGEVLYTNSAIDGEITVFNAPDIQWIIDHQDDYGKTIFIDPASSAEAALKEEHDG